jgi:hypothetical protein
MTFQDSLPYLLVSSCPYDLPSLYNFYPSICSGSQHHHPLIPLSGVGTTCFFLPFYSITRHLHAHSFYSHVILHTVHPSFLRSTSSRVPIYIHTHHSVICNLFRKWWRLKKPIKSVVWNWTMVDNDSGMPPQSPLLSNQTCTIKLLLKHLINVEGLRDG